MMSNAIVAHTGGKTKKSARGFLDSITSDFVALKPKTVLYGDQGMGKTSMGCYWGSDPKKNLFMQAGETGLNTLKAAGQVPKTMLAYPTDKIGTFDDWMGALQELAAGDHKYVGGTLVVDTLGGVQTMLEAKVLREVFHNNEAEFVSYAAGWKAAKPYWREMNKVLDAINNNANMGILLLCHRAIENFDPPDALKYTRYGPNLHKWMWDLTSAWTDMTLMLDVITVVQEQRGSGKAKAKGGTQRIVRTTHSATHDGKNRYGLPEIITLSNEDAKESCTIFQGEFKKAVSERKQK